MHGDLLRSVGFALVQTPTISRQGIIKIIKIELPATMLQSPLAGYHNFSTAAGTYPE